MRLLWELLTLLDHGFEASHRRGSQFHLHASHGHVALVSAFALKFIASFATNVKAFAVASSVWFYADVKLLRSVLLTPGGT
ncbi:unnamed protein product [Arabidopsis arenosa]|uniref:Uncharacterized protein n=1 Tax=Arabidopsis arenosa TaxID=38785 RepID=A0A8S2ARI1_ARAAE|nr:unnamed protein product [Arabidopsis arenosa]